MAENGKGFTRIGPPGTEMEGMLTESGMIVTACRPASTQLKARRLLDSWVSGDRQRLELELRLWQAGRRAAVAMDDDGREDLLGCLVDQMTGEPDLFALRSDKLHLGVWVDLLVHLAHPEVGEA